MHGCAGVRRFERGGSVGEGSRAGDVRPYRGWEGRERGRLRIRRGRPDMQRGAGTSTQPARDPLQEVCCPPRSSNRRVLTPSPPARTRRRDALTRATGGLIAGASPLGRRRATTPRREDDDSWRRSARRRLPRVDLRPEAFRADDSGSDIGRWTSGRRLPGSGFRALAPSAPSGRPDFLEPRDSRRLVRLPREDDPATTKRASSTRHARTRCERRRLRRPGLACSPLFDDATRVPPLASFCRLLGSS